MGAENKANEICITRVYEAPVKVVWDAWTDPEQTAKWWGPRGFSLTTHSKDLRVGWRSRSLPFLFTITVGMMIDRRSFV